MSSSVVPWLLLERSTGTWASDSSAGWLLGKENGTRRRKQQYSKQRQSGPGLTVPAQGEQGRPRDSSQVPVRVQIFRQVHNNYIGRRSSREGESASQGQEQVYRR